MQYGCLTGPHFWDLDANIAKEFRVMEKIRAELKMTAYNALNNLNLGDPNTNIYDSRFGQALYQGSPGGTFGALPGWVWFVAGGLVLAEVFS